MDMKTGDKVLVIDGQYKGRWGTFVDDYAMTRRIQDPDIPHVRLELKPDGKIILPKSYIETCQIPLPPNELLDAVYNAVSQNLIEIASDLIMQHVDEWMWHDMFGLCDTLLVTTDVERLDTYTIVIILSSTICAKERLPSRKYFVELAEARLKILAPDRIEGLMKGLY